MYPSPFLFNLSTFKLVNLLKTGRKGTSKNPGSQMKQAFNTVLTLIKWRIDVVLGK